MAQVAAVPQPAAKAYPEDDASVDTNDALLEMLGLAIDPSADGVTTNDSCSPPLTSILVMDEEEDPASGDDIDCHSKNNPLLVSIQPIPLPPRCARYGQSANNAVAVVVDHFVSAAECRDILELAQTDARGFQYITEASHTAPDGTLYKVPLQHPNPHKLAVFENHKMVDRLWKRMVDTKLLLKSTLLRHCNKFGPPRGLNPRLRVLQYDAQDQDRFEPHFDATTRVGTSFVSRITVLLYLNDGGGVDFEGGETRFLNAHISNFNNQHTTASSSSEEEDHSNDGQHVITPQTGRLVLFEHDLYHAGAPLQWGTKHVLRTDIVFEDDDSDDAPDTPPQDGTPPPKPLLVHDFCQEWTDQNRAVLDDLGVLHGTLESFLVPGVGLLTQLLLEGGIPRPQIDQLLKVVQEHVK
ncbi:P4Hc [Seminavis robusta]|uniref:P4Hc n=1 Tax=Seminavis robusta TaxID=568900 RepID=A0A9N8DCN9_9STRA|nr:P4Hc [Seminavis robusta]|eukprot:Sro36_g022760.1 P4Hc (410) ;mRNA; r:46317-47546